MNKSPGFSCANRSDFKLGSTFMLNPPARPTTEFEESHKSSPEIFSSLFDGQMTCIKTLREPPKRAAHQSAECYLAARDANRKPRVHGITSYRRALRIRNAMSEHAA